MRLRSLPFVPLLAARGMSVRRASLLWRVYRVDEPRSSDKTGKDLLSFPLIQALPLNHSLGSKTKGLCKHIACFQFEAAVPFSLLKGHEFFFHVTARLTTRLVQARPVLRAGTGTTK